MRALRIPKEAPVADVDYTQDGWWENLPSVDGVPAATSREDEPDEAGRAYLAELAARLEARAGDPDVRAFIDGGA